MTQRDRNRLVVLKKAQKSLITQQQAAGELGITPRQARRLLRRLKKEGDKAVILYCTGQAGQRFGSKLIH
jgi:predicted ArsR family transcriptional regulator